MKNVKQLVLGENFFVVSNFDMVSLYGEQLEQIMLIAKMSGYDVVFTTNRNELEYVSYSPTVHKAIKPEKSNDMIQIQTQEGKTLFYLTLTYSKDFCFFYEIGLNLMNEEVHKGIEKNEEYKEVMHSKYFYATTNFNEVRKVLDCALEIAKNI